MEVRTHLLRAIHLASSHLGSQRLGDFLAASWTPRNHSCYIHCALPCLARPWRLSHRYDCQCWKNSKRRMAIWSLAVTIPSPQTDACLNMTQQ